MVGAGRFRDEKEALDALESTRDWACYTPTTHPGYDRAYKTYTSLYPALKHLVL